MSDSIFPIRVRIAPSPTGSLHIGTARAALFNWLFARQNGGAFILRIEDTDLERSDPAYEADIIEHLRWLGLDWDEGPDIGGPYGPYRQSERRDIYARYLGKLLESGRAYHCFCSEEDLEAVRQGMLARGLAPRYGGKCRGLDPKTVKEKLAAGARSIIRLVMPSETVVIRDLIRGDVSFDTSLIGDIAIAKDMHTPLYNFAVVIDDAEMQITHVLRGEDHLSNTPKQWMIAEALALPHPLYGHFPLILGQDRSKLSKRHGATAVSQYREMGYLPEALMNFIALLGWHPEDEKEIFSREELIREFSLSRIQKGGAIFNPEKLDWLNGWYIRQKSIRELRELLQPYWKRAGFLKEGRGEQFLDAVTALERERLKKLSDIVEATEYFFRRPRPAPELLVWKRATREDTKTMLGKVLECLRAVPADAFDKKTLQEKLAPLYGDDRGKVLWPFRAALSGRQASPGPFEIAEVLGKEETLARLEYALTVL